MLRNLIQGLNKIKVASTASPSSIINKSNSPFLQQFLNTQPQVQLPINHEESNDLECMMNKTSRKTLKKHRKRINGKKSNMRRN
ncbi:hypothetical protein DDB_G0269336 [Dictyostelium discoideum AX4]|uniref:Uncharacterized protein n=1 Tax=Dictyostelium discoideum TaxID=44689 RepID=Q55E95_DICDI|nr:hypothetical protein DDB_G0269336 [Dictyostelium discoideum AX4]EAL72018.1 hypothetical protein DDB_G0269336 [Dictyostelium discoideum AX4]|eukprot:XP_645886.1 hypothetical protein DDB_G0269336 [Dictyostelium discoideum AX4]